VVMLCNGILRLRMNGGASQRMKPEQVRAETFRSDIASPPTQL
jgi:hypothetical protein